MNGRATPGHTWTIPLAPLASGEQSDRRLAAPGSRATVQGLSRREVKPFSLLGVTWTRPSSELDATVKVRTRSVDSGEWTRWQEVKVHPDHGPGEAEQANGRIRGGTAPLWVGPSNGVEVKVVPASHPASADSSTDRATASTAAATATRAPQLPEGLRLDMIDPGEAASGTTVPGPAKDQPDTSRGATAPAKAPAARDTEARSQNGPGGPAAAGTQMIKPEDARRNRASGPYVGPRPRIVSRAGWGADESLRESEFRYTGTVRLAFVHHSDTGNSYTCAEAPALIRAIYRYHVLSNGWRDMGYNFLIDKCGTIYEGRAGGVTKPVMGAHTYGFNSNSMGVAVLGSFMATRPSASAVRSVADLTAWKLGLFGVDPAASVTVTSGGGTMYPRGTRVRMRTISGHRNAYNTDCPGDLLYSRLGSIRSTAAALQGRAARK